MSIKQKIKETLLDNQLLSNWGNQLWSHFINGNYSESDYLNSLKMKKANKREQRIFTIYNYTRLLALEFGCSYGYAQRVIVGLFPKEKLESITNGFINDLNQLGE
jgi:hypothetical protein